MSMIRRFSAIRGRCAGACGLVLSAAGLAGSASAAGGVQQDTGRGAAGLHRGAAGCGPGTHFGGSPRARHLSVLRPRPHPDPGRRSAAVSLSRLPRLLADLRAPGMEGREDGERPDRGVRPSRGGREGVGRGGEGDGARVHLPQRGHEIPRHRAARTVDLGRRRVQFRRHRPHTGYRHAGRLHGARKRGREREHLRGRHGPALADALAGRDPAARGQGLLRDPRAVVQSDAPRAAVLQLDDRGSVRAGRPRALRAGGIVPGAFGPRASVAGGRGGPLPAAVPEQRVRRQQVVSRGRRAERLLRRLLPRRRLRLGALGPLRGHAGAEDVALVAGA